MKRKTTPALGLALTAAGLLLAMSPNTRHVARKLLKRGAASLLNPNTNRQTRNHTPNSPRDITHEARDVTREARNVTLESRDRDFTAPKRRRLETTDDASDEALRTFVEPDGDMHVLQGELH